MLQTTEKDWAKFVFVAAGRTFGRLGSHPSPPPQAAIKRRVVSCRCVPGVYSVWSACPRLPTCPFCSLAKHRHCLQAPWTSSGHAPRRTLHGCLGKHLYLALGQKCRVRKGKMIDVMIRTHMINAGIFEFRFMSLARTATPTTPYQLGNDGGAWFPAGGQQGGGAAIGNHFFWRAGSGVMFLRSFAGNGRSGACIHPMPADGSIWITRLSALYTISIECCGVPKHSSLPTPVAVSLLQVHCFDRTEWQTLHSYAYQLIPDFFLFSLCHGLQRFFIWRGKPFRRKFVS